MTQMKHEAYDEPHTRTRMAWLRTLLIVGGLTFLIERSLLLTNASRIVMVTAAVGTLSWVAIGLRRYFLLREVSFENVSTLVIVSVAILTGLSIPFAVASIVSG